MSYENNRLKFVKYSNCFCNHVVVSAFNLCKKQSQSWKKDEILSEFIWCKSLFKFKANTICFENWIEVSLSITYSLCQVSV